MLPQELWLGAVANLTTQKTHDFVGLEEEQLLSDDIASHYYILLERFMGHDGSVRAKVFEFAGASLNNSGQDTCLRSRLAAAAC